MFRVLVACSLCVPCVLRDVDGNAELIQAGLNGGLFKDNDQLAKVMLETVIWSKKTRSNRGNLLPQKFRQAEAAENYLELLYGEKTGHDSRTCRPDDAKKPQSYVPQPH